MALCGLNPNMEGPGIATNAPYDIGQMEIIITNQTMDIECRSKHDESDIFENVSQIILQKIKIGILKKITCKSAT